MRRAVGLRRLAAGLVPGLVLGLGLAGCSYEPTAVPAEPTPSVAEPAAPADCETDESTLASYAPSTSGGATVNRIRERGRLIVGVSADTYQMGFRDPATNRIVGFDIDLVRAVAADIFGAGFNPGTDIQFRVITASQRVPLLESGEIDMVVRNMTITCARWEQIAFSQVYYNATQKVLVGKETADALAEAGETFDVTDLADQRVCAPDGSTSLENIARLEPEAVVTPADSHTGCLVMFQQGEVDAITGDDTVLAGLVAQDPLAVVPDQEPLSAEPYGVGVGPEAADLAALVNATLEDMRAGAWDRSYRRWLEPYLGPATQPAAVQPYKTSQAG